MLICNNLLCVVIAESKIVHTSSTELFQPLVHVDGHFVVVFVSLVAQSEHLKTHTQKCINNSGLSFFVRNFGGCFYVPVFSKRVKRSPIGRFLQKL